MANPPTPQRLNEITWAFAAPIMVEAALHHGIFDLLDAGPKTAPEITTATSTSQRGMRSLLNGLVGQNLLAKKGEKYTLTDESAAFLVRGKPAFMGGLLKHMVGQLIAKWLELREVVKTGTPAKSVNQQGSGSEFFAQFVEDIFPMSYPAAQVLADSLAGELKANAAPLKGLDIAAGSGVWGIALAEKYPAMQITAVDWEPVLPVTRKVAQRHGVGDRLHTVAGDILQADFGQGYQVATLGHILHSEGVERSRKLIKKVFAALAPGGTIAISEFVANDDRTGPPGALIFSLNMLVNTEVGDTFTFPEISSWLKEAGFEKPRQLEAPAPSPLILASKPRR